MNCTKLIVMLSLVLLWGCSDTDTETPGNRNLAGNLVRVGTVSNLTLSEVETISIETLNGLKDILEISDPEESVITPFDLKHSIMMFRIIYLTENSNGDVVSVSGALIAPVSSDEFPILAIQHGMVTHRDNVASEYVNSLGSSSGITPELLTGILTASRGYITLLPDYLGFGISEENHPFCHRQLTASTVVDMFRAVEPHLAGLNIRSNGERFLFGHSQGGYSSIAALDLFEQSYDLFPITACAASAGPYALSVMVEEVLAQELLIDNLYGPYLLVSTINSGVGSIDEVFHESLADLIPSYFDGTKSALQLRLTLPEYKDEIFNLDFISSMESGTGVGEKYYDEIGSHDLLDLSPETKVNLYYGENDIHIPGHLNALKADSAWSANGTPSGLVTPVMLNQTDHVTSFIPALLHAMEWFSTM